jgi:hypothetical protein
MQDLFANPAFQSVAAPFAVALAAALALKPLRLSGLALIAGVAVCIHLAISFDLFPLSATRKIVFLGLAAALAGVVLDLAGLARGRLRWVIAFAGAVALVWVLFPALSQRDLALAIAYGAGLAAFTASVVWGFDALSDRPVRAGSAALAMGLATGAAAILGASASLGQIALAIGAASGGYLLVQMITGKTLPGGRSFTFPAGLLTALIAAAVVVLASLPWFALPLLAVVPFAAGLPFGDRLPLWLQAIVHSAIAFVFGLAALAVVRHAAGS